MKLGPLKYQDKGKGRSKVEISQNFLAFSEFMNFTLFSLEIADA
jgi:hypothetical protein